MVPTTNTCYFQPVFSLEHNNESLNHMMLLISVLTLQTNSKPHKQDIITHRPADRCGDSVTMSLCQSMRHRVGGGGCGSRLASTQAGEKWPVAQRHSHIKGQRMWLFNLWKDFHILYKHTIVYLDIHKPKSTRVNCCVNAAVSALCLLLEGPQCTTSITAHIKRF